MEIDVVTEGPRVYYRFEEIPESAGEIAVYPEQILSTIAVVDDLPADLPFATPQTGFWGRQFAAETTGGQRKFDWFFGVAMPLVCFLFDPIVFRSNFNDAILGKFQAPAYVLAFVSIMAMTAWLLWGERLKWLNGWLAGLFFVGSGISLIVGAIIFPFSLYGMLLLIGFLGFTPLFSSIVFLRNGVRAMRSASRVLERAILINVAVLGGMIAIAVPCVIRAWLR